MVYLASFVVSDDTQFGAIAQLGERLPCTQEVCGSIPHSSTILFIASLGSERSLFIEVGFVLVLTTGKFFNKVNQAESLDFSSTLAGSSGCVGGEKDP